MRVLVVFAHPVETSLSAALHAAVVASLGRAGHQVDDCDLYAEGFDPVMSRAERLGYHDVATNRTPVNAYVDRLLAAEAVVFVNPVWNFGFPAILKGYFDRVFLPGISFRIENGRLSRNLTNIRRAAVVTTYGATRWRAFLAGDPPRRYATRVLAATFQTRLQYLALYDMNNVTRAGTDAFRARVEAAMGRF